MSQKVQPQETASPPAKPTSRRDFIKKSSLLVAGGAVAGNLSIARSAHAFGSDTIKIGLVGSGGRGTGAAVQALNTSGPIELIAMGDVFPDQLQAGYRGINSAHPDKVKVGRDTMFAGFDAYRRVLETDIDLVILATPPGFRPLHFEAAVKAGKHVFMEKPVAVDAPGVRRVLAANEEARKKNLAVAVGLQRHHEEAYKQTIGKLQDGAIGDILLTRVYWNGDGVWVRERKENQTEIEYQMRNWYYFNWLCGDHINEQHIHNLDVINWLKDAYPVEANGQGGRQVRTGIDHGEIFDHHFVEYTYADGSKLFSQCRHIPDCWSAVSEFAHGTNGSADISGAKIFDRQGERSWAFGAGGGNGHQEEHHNLFAALRRGERPNEGDYGAKSTLTAILGRMATYSGKKVRWDDAFNSKLAYADIDAMENASWDQLDDLAPIRPDKDGRYPIAIPGVTEAV